MNSEDLVYLYDCKKYNYVFEKFNPSKEYAELKNINMNLLSDKEIYDAVRSLFISMKFDEKNIGKKTWNPFKDFIKKGQTVLIKPNLVLHRNENKLGTTDSLITNFSIIRPIVDYVILALGNTGKIIVGDAPVQDCDFNELKKINNLEKNILSYKKIYKNIHFLDFRKNQNPDVECLLVNLGKESTLCEIQSDESKFAVTNYDLTMMHVHHNKDKHEYIIPKCVLESDVIINLPKPKTHKKAGITACMKNFVGINGNKECLPHHRIGCPIENGDEYRDYGIFPKMYSYFLKQSYKKNLIIDFFRKCSRVGLILTKKNIYKEGNWYGNETLPRTIVDLNKAITYSDKNGNIKQKPQRIIFSVCDMIISGEKEGPMAPIDKEVGYIVAGFNVINNDYIICKLMGFDPNKIKYISRFITNNNMPKCILANDGKTIKNIDKYKNRFTPASGWEGYL